MRSGPRLARPLTAALIGLALAATAGCGSSGATGSGAASHASTTAGPDTSWLSKAGFEAAVKHTYTADRSAHLVMRITGGGARIRGVGDLRLGSSTMALRLTLHAPELGPRKLQVVLVDDVAYLAIPPLTPKGTFVKIDPKDTSSQLGSAMGGLTGTLDLNGRHSMDLFTKGVRTVRYVGQESVDGEQMGHYVVTMSATKGARLFSKQAGASVPRHVTYDAWLDGRQRLRRTAVRSAGASVVIDLSHWGEKLEVTAPPASAVTSSLPGM